MTLKQAQTARHTERQQQNPSSPSLPFVVGSQVLKVLVKEHSPEVVLFPSPISLIPKLIPFYRLCKVKDIFVSITKQRVLLKQSQRIDLEMETTYVKSVCSEMDFTRVDVFYPFTLICLMGDSLETTETSWQ